MSLTAAASGFVVFLLSVPVIQGQNGWGVTYTSTQICASKGSTVDIHCTYTYPSTVTNITQTFWHLVDGRDVKTVLEYTGRVQYYCGNNKTCTLRISDLRQSDSVEYRFRFITNQAGGMWSGTPGVTLSVTAYLALQMGVNKVTVNPSDTEAELSCNSSCSKPSYVWIKNGQKVPEEASSYTAYLNPGDSIACALKGQEKYHTPLLYAPKVPSVSVSPSAEIVEGSSVNLTCSSDANPAANYTWYKENEDSPKASGQIFTITDFRAEHSGNYYCEAQNSRGRQNSTLHLTVVAGTSPLRAAGPISVVLLAVLSLSVFLWIRPERGGLPGTRLDQTTGNSVYLIRVSQRSRLTFSTPPSTSPTARQILCTPTSELLSPSDTGSNRKPLSTLPSASTVAVLPREPEVGTLERIQLLCTAQSTTTDENNRHCIYSLIFLSFFPQNII
ncbi:B-cell receptor CD22-like [Perca fluviatilis]|uniref:B-cell receptor CD22-like n=1 Tax=Perca fluviatilis TaxID=8168 RepID=UPI0019641E54|nr:B-cell receptor CD22-like [Perca fluviatilis]